MSTASTSSRSSNSSPVTIPLWRGTLLVGMGGFVGAWTRWVLGELVHGPWTLVTVNLVGSLLLGLLVGWLGRRSAWHGWQLLLGTGLLGAFTSYSALALDTVGSDGGSVRLVVTVLGGIALAGLGLWLMQRRA